MAHYTVADGDTVANDSVSICVQYGVVLNVRSFSDFDAARICSDHSTRPDAGVCTDDDIADDMCGLGNVGGRVHHGAFAVEFA